MKPRFFLPLLALQGCLSVEPLPPDPARTRLVEAALRAEASLSRLATMTDAPAPLAPRAVPPELAQKLTLDWTGSVDVLARSLAGRAGYEFRTAGPRPLRPVMINLVAVDKPLVQVLRDAAIQAAETVTLTVDAENRVIQLDFASPLFGTSP